MRWPTWKRRRDDEQPLPAFDISAYLDNELSPAELAAFEARMAGNGELAHEVAEMRALKALTKAMPEVAPRRSFAITPEMLAEPKPVAAPAKRPPEPARGFAPLLVFARAATAAGVAGLGILTITAISFDGGTSADDAAGGATELRASAESAMAPMSAEDGATKSGEGDGGSAGALASTATVQAVDTTSGTPGPVFGSGTVVVIPTVQPMPPDSGDDDGRNANTSQADSTELQYGAEDAAGFAEDSNDETDWRLLLTIASGVLAVGGAIGWTAIQKKRGVL